MKKLYKYIVFVIGILAFSACADEELVGSFGETGGDVILKLDVQTQANKNIVVSRATAEENKLYDLHFYVFNAQGELTGYEKLVSATGDITSPWLDTNNDKIAEGIPVTIRTKTGASYIYALANINSGSIYKLSDADKALLNVTDDATNNKTTEQEVKALRETVESSTLNMTTFKNITFNRTLPTGNEVISPSPIDKIFMMSGYLNDGAAVTIQKSGNNVSIQEGVNVIKLYRILAKNTLTINSPIDNTTQKPRFTLKSYRLHNVPVGGQLVPNAMISTANTAVDYTTGNITTAEVESHYQNYEGKSSFEFYYPENLQTSNSTIGVWKDREKNSWNTEGTQKTFTNAPANAAYIEIQGDYVDNTGKLSANVSYTIHLGNFGDTEKGGNLSNFNVIRNNNYIYTITINGVNDIIAEAQIESDDHNDNPYAEGFVIKVGSGQHFEVDAHYEARVMAFNMSDIWALKDNGKGYILSVETPFSKTNQTVYVKNDGVYSLTGTKLCEINDVAGIFTSTPDFEWIKFVRNTEDNRTNANNDIGGYTCKYPGDGDENNPRQWLNVFELLAELHNNASSTNTSTVYYTCFIDENYYANKAWSDYVNRDPRTMQIANNLFISSDKKSVYAEVAYSISQRSIATFYKDNSLVAFGTEIFDEEDLFHTEDNPTRVGEKGSTDLYENLPIDTETADDPYWDGHTGTQKTNTGLNWYGNDEITVSITTTDRWGRPTTTTKDVTIESNIIKGIQPMYKSAAKACMSRNRDLNGDGVITDGEVRWYLASVQQYHALYIAKNSLPAESALISEQELQTLNEDDYYSGWPQSGHDIRGKYHYYTSSPKDGYGTYWPEEGMTNNGVEESNSFMQRAEMVRCVRTLESGTNVTNGEKYGLRAPEKYYKFENNIFNLTGIETRRAVMPVLANHHELQELNELNSRFEVAKKSLYSSASYSLLNLTGQEYDPCKEEYSQEDDKSDLGTWRTPNQKEVALMLAEIPDEMTAQRHGTRTRFSAYNGDNGTESWHGPYSWHTRYAFSVETSGKFNVTGDNASVNIRCVRDK